MIRLPRASERVVAHTLALGCRYGLYTGPCPSSTAMKLEDKLAGFWRGESVILRTRSMLLIAESSVFGTTHVLHLLRLASVF
jgi:hypothetical protein